MSASDIQIDGDHYRKLGDFQPWNVLAHWLTPEEYRGYQKGVAIAYLARELSKGGDSDIRKAAHHLQRLIEELDKKGGDKEPPFPEIRPDMLSGGVALCSGSDPDGDAAPPATAAEAAPQVSGEDLERVGNELEELGSQLGYPGGWSKETWNARLAKEGWLPWTPSVEMLPPGVGPDDRVRVRSIDGTTWESVARHCFWGLNPFSRTFNIIDYRVVRRA